MGVYIKGMDMPREGYRQVFITADGDAICFPSTPQNGELRFKAIPVSEHGDLIDRKELSAKVEYGIEHGTYKVCDRCGTVINPPNSGLYIILGTGGYRTGNGETKDLCCSCALELRKFLRMEDTDC